MLGKVERESTGATNSSVRPAKSPVLLYFSSYGVFLGDLTDSSGQPANLKTL